MAIGDKFIRLDSDLYQYIVSHGHNHDPVLDELAQETRALGPISAMEIAPEQGTLMGMLVRLSGAKSAVEIGTFTGYSSICVARALPADGRLLCCDVSAQWTSIARRYWEKAGVADKITLKVAPALETLRALPDSAVFDFAFIDADKENYPNYYEEVLRRTRRNGLILFDNVLWGGSVARATDQSPDAVAIRRVNDKIAADARVEAVMLGVADGLTIARKR